MRPWTRGEGKKKKNKKPTKQALPAQGRRWDPTKSGGGRGSPWILYYLFHMAQTYKMIMTPSSSPTSPHLQTTLKVSIYYYTKHRGLNNKLDLIHFILELVTTDTSYSFVTITQALTT